MWTKTVNSAAHNNQMSETALPRINFVRLLIVLAIALGYASTMPLGPGNPEKLAHLGFDPSWIGIQLLFFFSGFLALRSFRRHGSSFEYLRSRFFRNIPLLALFTLVTVVLIYPAFGVMPENPADLIKKLGLYYFETVTCLDPGQPLPGLLDSAKYMCLIQGAIWTFRWGVIAHVLAAIGNRIGVFKHNPLILIMAALSTLTFFIMAHVKAWHGVPIPENFITAVHLGFPFLCGMAAYAYRDRLPKKTGVKAIWLLGFIGVAIFWHSFLPWSPAIELLLTAFWIYAAMLVLGGSENSNGILAKCPDLTLPLYLITWPVSQLILLGLPSLGPWQLIAISVPVSLVLAIIIHYAVGGRMNRFFKSVYSEKSALKPPALSQA